jgi:UDPglucose 6-dehydrogenase
MSSVAIVGLGKLGTVMAALFAEAGHDVVGIDTDPEAVAAVLAGEPRVHEPGLAELLREHPVRCSTSFDEVAWADFVFVIVPTPSLDSGAFSNAYVVDAIRALGPHLRPNAVVVVSSTVAPGSSDGELAEQLDRASDGRATIAYSPQFIALGSIIHDMRFPDLLLVGANDEQVGRQVAEVVASVMPHGPGREAVMNLVNAEVTKIAVNQYLVTKVSWVNTLSALCERLPGGDAFVVADAVGADSRIGRKFLTPGGPAAGPCLPRDSAAFEAACAAVDVSADIARAADRINHRQIERLATLVPHDAHKVLILGMAYKPGTPVIDEAVGGKLCYRLIDAGHKVLTWDPLACPDGDPDELVRWADAVVVTTNDPVFQKLRFHAHQVVIDCWAVIGDDQLDPEAVLKRLGVASS